MGLAFDPSSLVILELGKVLQAQMTVPAGNVGTLEIEPDSVEGTVLLTQLLFEGANTSEDILSVRSDERSRATSYLVLSPQAALQARGILSNPLIIQYSAVGANNVTVRADYISLNANEWDEAQCLLREAL